MELPLDTSAVYEEARIKFARDFRAVMKEEDIPLEYLAFQMGITERKLRRMIYKDDLRFSELVSLIFLLGGTFRPYIVIASWPPDAQRLRKRSLIDRFLGKNESPKEEKGESEWKKKN